MDDLKQVTKFPSGIVKMPPSKSVAHRAIICAALANGHSLIDNIAYSQDIEATIRCVRALGSEVKNERGSIKITGSFGRCGDLLDCGESGTTLRFLIPIAALLSDEMRFTGQGRLMRRPLGPYMETLKKFGVSFLVRDDVLTLKGPLASGMFELPGDISSQFVSGLLLALPLLEQDSKIRLTTPLQSASYVELTLDMMARFGVHAEKSGDNFTVAGGQKYEPADILVEADYSQAAFFLVAGALGCPCECRGLSAVSKQGDRKIIEILKRSGARIETTAQGGLIAKPGELAAQTVDVSDIPDLVPPLAALLAFCEGESRIVGAKRLRHKESDRLLSVSTALNALGAKVIIDKDSLIINGVSSLSGGKIDSFGDHRIAMMGAVAAIKSDNPVWIGDSGCVAKSYPDFWADFEKTEKEG